MTGQQYKWQCPICDVCLNFAPHPLPESLTLQIVEEVRKMNANSYMMILAERGQHMMNHIMKGEGIGMLGRIKKELEKEEPAEQDLHGGPGPLMFEAEEAEEEEEHEEAAPTLDAEKGEEETQKEEQDEVERKEDLDEDKERTEM